MLFVAWEGVSQGPPEYRNGRVLRRAALLPESIAGPINPAARTNTKIRMQARGFFGKPVTPTAVPNPLAYCKQTCVRLEGAAGARKRLVSNSTRHIHCVLPMSQIDAGCRAWRARRPSVDVMKQSI